MFFDQLFTWPTDQPRHATSTCGNPVESNRPRVFRRSLTSQSYPPSGRSQTAMKVAQGEGEKGRQGETSTTARPSRQLSLSPLLLVSWSWRGCDRHPPAG